MPRRGAPNGGVEPGPIGLAQTGCYDANAVPMSRHSNSLSMRCSAMANVPETIERYGGDASAILRFGRNNTELLPYAALTNARASGLADFQAFYGVYEWQGRPLVLLVDGGRARR